MTQGLDDALRAVDGEEAVVLTGGRCAATVLVLRRRPDRHRDVTELREPSRDVLAQALREREGRDRAPGRATLHRGDVETVQRRVEDRKRNHETVRHRQPRAQQHAQRRRLAPAACGRGIAELYQHHESFNRKLTTLC